MFANFVSISDYKLLKNLIDSNEDGCLLDLPIKNILNVMIARQNIEANKKLNKKKTCLKVVV